MAKGRLADTLSAHERETIARSCAKTVIEACSPLPVYVVCSDATVSAWATSLGARSVLCETPGLDIAVDFGRKAAARDGADHLIVAHADLPLARSLSHIAIDGAVSLVPDRHRDGTNVLSFPIASMFTTAYGPGSYDNHVQLAHDAGLACHTIVDDDLALDLDTADDLSELLRRQEEQQS